jgi:hypothetical protein
MGSAEGTAAGVRADAGGALKRSRLAAIRRNLAVTPLCGAVPPA